METPPLPHIDLPIIETESPRLIVPSATSENVAATVQQTEPSSSTPQRAVPPTSPRSAGMEDSLQSSILLLLGFALAQKSVGFIRNVIVCRWLDPVNMGSWGMALALMETILPLCLLSVPGCFGRYVEHFRQRGQLKAFLRQAAMLCLSSLGLSVLLLCWFRGPIATISFGSADHGRMLTLAVMAMIPSALFAFCAELLVALRRSRTSTVGTFWRGITFTVLSIGLLCWHRSAVSMIVAFGISYLVCLLFVVPPAVRAIGTLEDNDRTLPATRTWVGLSRFLLAYWVTDFLTNMFFTIDRYMLINLGQGEGAELLAQVGNYESAQVIPVLIATMVMMAARLTLPYLVREWEADNREWVWNHIHLCIKTTALVLFAAGWVIVLAARPIFIVWFRGQYVSGLQVVPIAVAIYSLSGLAAYLLNYFLCIERASLGTLVTLAAVLFNALINWMLIPRYGLMGAAWATLIANCILVGLSLLLAHRHGLLARWDTIVLMFLPLAVCVPPLAAAAILVALVSLLASGHLINGRERLALWRLQADVRTRLWATFSTWQT